MSLIEKELYYLVLFLRVFTGFAGAIVKRSGCTGTGGGPVRFFLLHFRHDSINYAVLCILLKGLFLCYSLSGLRFSRIEGVARRQFCHALYKLRFNMVSKIQ